MRALVLAAFLMTFVACGDTDTRASDPPLDDGWVCCELADGCTSGPVADQDRAVDACKTPGGRAFTDSSLSCDANDKCQ